MRIVTFLIWVVLVQCGYCTSIALPAWEIAELDRAISRNYPQGLPNPLLRKVIMAIRLAENGSAGREYGILNAKANTYSAQAGWAVCTVVKNYYRWDKEVVLYREPNFIKFLGRRYAPIGVANDPNGLNKNWIKNVLFFYKNLGGK